jgi:hypothetical protein
MRFARFASAITGQPIAINPATVVAVTPGDTSITIWCLLHDDESQPWCVKGTLDETLSALEAASKGGA